MDLEVVLRVKEGEFAQSTFVDGLMRCESVDLKKKFVKIGQF